MRIIMRDEQIELLKALADVTRQEILEHLARETEFSVNELCALFEHMTQPTISHHLQVLKRSRLVNSERRGKMIYYSLRRGPAREVFEVMIERFTDEEDI